MKIKHYIFTGVALAGAAAAAAVPAIASQSAARETKPEPPSKVTMSHPNIYGGVIMTDDPDFADWGIYRVPTSDDGEFTRVARGAEGMARGGGVGSASTYTAVRYFSFYGMEYVQAYFYDIDTWAEQEQIKIIDRDLMAYDLGYDPVSEKIYGCFYSKDSDTDCWFGIADYQNGTRTTISQVEKWNAFAFDKNGNAFAIDMNGDLLSVDKQTGETTKVGSTGVVPRYPSSGTIDPHSGLMYWVVCPEDGHSYLYTVDLATAEATYVLQFAHDEQVTGLYIPMPEAEDGAPAAVSGLTLDFPNGELSGNVTFTMPATNFGGEPIDGTLEWSMTCEGLADKSGTASAGEQVTVPVTVETAGEYEFCVSSTNSVGMSPKARKKMYIGNGVPAATTATVTYADGQATIEWTPVTESVDGGYLDPAAVTYSVLRLPDNVVLEEATTATSLVTDLPEPAQLTSYQFKVTPSFRGLTGESALTGKITLGSVTPPYRESFDSADALGAFTTVDANGDSKCWEYADDGSVRLFYCSSGPCDDWLISPPVMLEAGTQYRVTFDVRNSYGDSYPERIEVKAGTEPDAEHMTVTMLEPMDITDDNWRNVAMTIIPEQSGRYFIGIHGISDPDQFWVGIDNLSIEAGVSLKSPAAATDIAAIADINGSNEVEVSFTAPVKTLDDNELGEITRIDVWRDDVEEPVKTFTTVSPGEKLSFKDSEVPTGTHVYTVKATNSFGTGASGTASTFVGINTPAKVTDVVITEGSTGYATVTWKAPEFDKDGNPINPDFISYTITDMYSDPIETDVKGTTYTTRVTRPGNQEFALFGIIATTTAGESDPVFSNMIPVGDPYETPYRDSFNENFGGIMGTTRISGYPNWAIASDSAIEGVASHDADDSYLTMNAQVPGDCGAVYTGKISLNDCVTPALSFYINQFVGENGEKDDTNTLDVEIREAGTEEYTALKTIVNNTLDEAGWNRVIIPLDEYKGKIVQLRFKVLVSSYSVYAIDNLTVGDIPNSNLGLVSLTAPKSVKPDTDFEVAAIVANSGLADASAFKVEFMRDEELIEEQEVAALASGKTVRLSFNTSLPYTQTADVVYSARVVWAADEDSSDNEAETEPVSVEFSDLPAVGNVTGNREPEHISLEWDAIDLDNMEVTPVTDSFEEYTPFSLNPGGEWTFIDADKGQTYVPQSVEIEGLGDDSAYAFIVMDATHPNFNGTFAARTGDKYLGAFYCNDYMTQNNDWAITPKLSGEAQTIEFYAKNYNSAYGSETFEVRYSTTGTAVEDFTETVLTQTLEGNDWTHVTAELPEGAKYAAIHYISDNQYMFFVDDFTYMPAPWSERVTLVGYNVYRDGVRITETPVTETKYSDEKAGPEHHIYNVTAVYDCGESAPSADLYIEQSGIDGVYSGIRVFAVEGNVCVAGAEGLDIEISAISGMNVAAVADAPDFVKVAVEPGIYVVRVAGRAVKLIVK